VRFFQLQLSGRRFKIVAAANHIAAERYFLVLWANGIALAVVIWNAATALDELVRRDARYRCDIGRRFICGRGELGLLSLGNRPALEDDRLVI
jgi:hypothetical protein